MELIKPETVSHLLSKRDKTRGDAFPVAAVFAPKIQAYPFNILL